MTRILKTCLLLLAVTTVAAAPSDSTRIYSEQHPLVYEDAWDLWPYTYLNEQGEPEGFNIDLVRRLCEELDIPYIIRLKPTAEALEDLEARRSDLMLGMDASFHDQAKYFGKQTIQLFTHSVVTPVSKPVTIRTVEDLGRHFVMVHQGSFSHHLMQDSGWAEKAIPYSDMKEVLLKVGTDEEGLVVWNTLSLRWLIQKFQMDNVRLTPVDMPHGEYKFMANDPRLLHRLDSVYAKLRSTEELQPIFNKWLYPERQETGIPEWVWYVGGLAAFAALILLLYNVGYRMRERRMNSEIRQHIERLSLILSASHVQIWTYDVARRVFVWMDRKGQPEREYTVEAFSRRYHAGDFDRLYEAIRQIADQEQQEVTLEVKAHDEDDDQERDFVIDLSVLRSENDRPAVIIGTKSDITDERRKQRETNEQMQRYQSVFDSTMVDMVYYDENGDITDMNERAQRTFHMNLKDTLQERVNVRTAIEDPNLDIHQFEPYHATQFLNTMGESRNIKSRKLQSVMYYELKLVPVFDQLHRLLCIYGTGRDVTEVADAYHRVKESLSELREATEKTTGYVENINYVLGVGGVRMATYSPDTHALTIYRGLDIVQHTLLQPRCMTLVCERSKKTAMRAFISMDNRQDKAIDAEILTTLRLKGMPLYLNFRFIPTYDQQGHVSGYFGLCRDQSEMKRTEQLLARETVRAQEVETQKNAFLHNMNYEIRTPLNSVVGFAELFEQERDQADRDIFVREIKDNAAHLLRLINDILFLSRLDARMIEINKKPTDFSKTFESHCRTGWDNDRREGVEYVVENPYEQFVVNIDDSNVGRIISEVAANAAQHTESGTVRARYDYINGNLVIAIEDTGLGMAPETLATIYERFTSGPHRGTGLGMPICKDLAEQMGGSIDVSSGLGMGTTVWITMPCEATAITRKK